MSVDKLLKDVKDFSLYADEDEIIEEFDTVYDLFFEIELIIYNNYLNTLEDLKSEEYLDVVRPYYIVDKKSNKISLLEFVPLVGSGEGEWYMTGDRKYISE